MPGKASGTIVSVLGGAHDLSDNVPEGIKLIVLTVEQYADVSGEVAVPR